MIVSKVAVFCFAIFWLSAACTGETKVTTNATEEDEDKTEDLSNGAISFGQDTILRNISDAESSQDEETIADDHANTNSSNIADSIAADGSDEGDPNAFVDAGDAKPDGSDKESDDAAAKPEGDGNSTADMPTVTTSSKDEGLLTNRVVVIMAALIATVVVIVLVILLCMYCRGGSGGGQKSEATGDRQKPPPKKLPVLTTTTPDDAYKDKGPKDETSPSSPPPKTGAGKKQVSKSESAEAPSGSIDSKKELEPVATLNGKESKPEPLTTSSPKLPAKQMSFAEQMNMYKQLCNQFDPAPASSGTSSS